jgi:hypothetical protein
MTFQFMVCSPSGFVKIGVGIVDLIDEVDKVDRIDAAKVGLEIGGFEFSPDPQTLRPSDPARSA